MAAGITDGASSITVAVRVRPFTIREAAQLQKTDDGPLFLGDGSLAGVPAPRLGGKGIRSVIKVVDDKCLIFDPPEDAPVSRYSRAGMGGKRTKDQTYGFDKVFDENVTQADVYEATTKTLLDSVFDGYNATVFAYGATGCGKTHTITGTSAQPGIIFLTMQELFERIGDQNEEKVTDITLSYLEIYNETIRDLLSPGMLTNKAGLMLREDANQAVSVAGLSSHRPQNVSEVMEMLIQGNAARTQSPTEANATSSRSHAVLQINVAQKERNANISEPTTMATLSIIDLAGSERASATKNRGERLLEGANINKSLLALGSCINALCDPRKKNHVPYRNSKLTRLLKFSLGGNCRTVMIVCCSPSSQHFDETQNTLRYANRTKNIQTKVMRNVYNVDRHVKDYLKKIDEQMARINELQAQQKEFESLAFNKFRKQEDKKDAISKEGIERIRLAYTHSVDERRERVGMMKRLRQIERRIAAISAWIGSFDQVCETRDDEDPPKSLVAMRKTAQGILVELEGSRQHYHRKLAKSNWERQIDTAVQNGVRQIQEADPTATSGTAAIDSLKREYEVLKGKADREAHTAVLEQEKQGETALLQIMLQAHFETVAILGQIMQMEEQEAVSAAKSVLGKLLTSCTESVGQVIRPDGGLQIVDAVPPTRSGTPKKKKSFLAAPAPIKAKIRPSLANANHLRESPASATGSIPTAAAAKASPRRRKLGGAKKGVSFGSTSRTRSPAKPSKRGVRWRDDTEDGELADFQATPPALDGTPSDASESFADTSFSAPSSSTNYDDDSVNSSPIPAPPVPSSDLRNSSASRTSSGGRFAAGFLSKHGPPSSPAPTFTLNLPSHPFPLRETTANAPTPSSSSLPPNEPPRADSSFEDYNSSDAEPSATAPPPAILPGKRVRVKAGGGTEAEAEADTIGLGLAENKDAARKLHSVMKAKRTSSGAHAAALRRERRRSPSATASPPPSSSSSTSSNHNSASGSGSSSSSGMFTAGQARRMVSSSRKGGASEDGGGGSGGDWGKNVLSPRSQPVLKGVQSLGNMRRSHASAGAGAGAEGLSLGGRSGPIRVSTIGSSAGGLGVSGGGVGGASGVGGGSAGIGAGVAGSGGSLRGTPVDRERPGSAAGKAVWR